MNNKNYEVANFNEVAKIDRSKMAKVALSLVNGYRQAETKILAEAVEAGTVKVPNFKNYGGEEIPCILLVIQGIKQTTVLTKAEKSLHYVKRIVGGETVAVPVLAADGKSQALSPISNLPMFRKEVTGGKEVLRTEVLTPAEKESKEVFAFMAKVPFLASSSKPNKTIGEGLQTLEEIILPQLLNGRNFAKGKKNGLYFMLQVDSNKDGKYTDVVTYEVTGNEVSSTYLLASTYTGLEYKNEGGKKSGSAFDMWSEFASLVYQSFKRSLMVVEGTSTLNEAYTKILNLK